MTLDTLRRIVQQVSTATNLDEALAIAVRQVKAFMQVDVCSVYLTDNASERYVLIATDGLHPSSVGHVHLHQNEGLVGLVGKRQEPVNVERASEHPSFRYFPETEEEHYHAFLGVPLINFRQLIGVLVVQQRAERLFASDETAFLITVAAQLAAAINTAAVSGAQSRSLNERSQSNRFIQGIAGAPGIAIGTVVLPSPFANLSSVPDRIANDINTEEALLKTAIEAVQDDLRTAAQRMASLLPSEVHSVFDVYKLFLDDDWLWADTIKRIHAGNWAPGAWRDTINEHAQAFEQLEDPYLQARAEDIRAIGRRVLMRLQDQTQTVRDYPERCILLGDEVSVTRIADVPIERLAGVVCLQSSALSHTAILARALGIPAVMGLGNLTIGRLENVRLAIDGYQGRVFIDPSQAVLEDFSQLLEQEENLSMALRDLRGLPAETPDGTRISLYVNSGLLAEAPTAAVHEPEGIGLYRTEFPFMMRHTFPDESEQYQIYRDVLAAFAPKPVTMRSLDIGGDKPLPYFAVDEANPFLGWRGIRVTLDHPEIFRTQLRALLRANAGLNNLRILLPMISRIEEIDEAMKLLDIVYNELLEEEQHVIIPPLGAMIEVPSAVFLTKALAERLDFLSLGTNDLTQYILAVDRNNTRVAPLYDCLHPAVINAIREVVTQAHACGKPVTLCGEMAGDPCAAILLLGMGLDGLSMNAASLPRMKWVIRSFSKQQAAELLDKAMSLESETAIRDLLNQALQQAGLDRLVRPREIIPG